MQQRAHARDVERRDPRAGDACAAGGADRCAAIGGGEQRGEAPAVRTPQGAHRVGEARALEQRRGREHEAVDVPLAELRAPAREQALHRIRVAALVAHHELQGGARAEAQAVLGEHREQRALLDPAAQHGVDDARDALGEGLLARLVGEPRQHLALAGEGALEGGPDQAVLVAEVLVERADRDACRARDAVGGRARVAVAAQHLLGGVEQGSDGVQGPRLARSLPVVLRCFERQDGLHDVP